LYRVRCPGTNVFSAVNRVSPSIPPPFPFLFLYYLFSFIFFLFSLFFNHSHNIIYTKIICTTNYSDLIEPNHSHKIHKLQHQFDIVNHNHTTTRIQEPLFQISQELSVNKHKNLLVVLPTGPYLAARHHSASSQPLACTPRRWGRPRCRVGRSGLRCRPPT
jgi:hypothetical protein